MQLQWLLWWMWQEFPGWVDASWKGCCLLNSFYWVCTRKHTFRWSVVCAERINNKPSDAEFLELNQKLLLLSVMKHPDSAPTPVSALVQDRVAMAVFSWQCALAVPLPSFFSASFLIVNTNSELCYLPTFLPATAASGAALRCGL